MVNHPLLNQKSALDVAAIKKTEREYHEAKAQARKKLLVASGDGGASKSGGGLAGATPSVLDQPGVSNISAKSSLLADVEKIRLGILEILEGDIDSLDKMPGAMDKLTSLDNEVKELRQEVQKLSKDLVAALGKVEKQLSGVTVSPGAPQGSGDAKQGKPEAKKPAAPAKDDDDIDLFGSDDDKDDPEADKLRQDRLAAYETKKAKKPALIAKSNIILDVKPWDDETDLKAMEQKVRSIEADGLLWGASKLVPIAFGIQKLQISCVVEDDKISTDWLEEQICAHEDFVQSIDIAAFNKV